MKIKVTVKDPDALHEQVVDAVRASLIDLGLEEDELEPLIDKRTERVMEKLGRWIEYGEYYFLEFDTDAMTATVLPVKS